MHASTYRDLLSLSVTENKVARSERTLTCQAEVLPAVRCGVVRCGAVARGAVGFGTDDVVAATLSISSHRPVSQAGSSCRAGWHLRWPGQDSMRRLGNESGASVRRRPPHLWSWD